MAENNNPWLSIWVQPRETIRQIVAQNPKRSLWLLAFIYGFPSLLNCFQSYPGLMQFGVFPALLVALIIAPFWGYAFFAIWSWAVVFVGKLLKGQASFDAARAAYAWSSVPLLANIPLWLLLILFYSNFIFFGVPGQIVLEAPAAMLLFTILIGKLVFAIWSLVIYLQGLSEVQQFSVLRAIGNVILAALFLGICAAVIWTLIAAIVSGVMHVAVINWNPASWIVQQIK